MDGCVRRNLSGNWIFWVFGGAVCGFLPARQALVAGDESCAVFEGEVGPGPGGKDGDAVAEANEEEDMHGEPGGPSHETTPVGFEGPFDLGYGG